MPENIHSPSFFRGRRLRRTDTLRALVQETRLTANDLIMPYFVVNTPDPGFCKPIEAMPGQSQLSVEQLRLKVEKAVGNGLRACLLFGIPAHKDEQGSEGWSDRGAVQQACRMLKENFPGLTVITDVCMCEYTSHGHCGLLDGEDVDNDPTLELLCRCALSHAQAGADIVAPSAMMDGTVQAIRVTLDANGFSHIPIMSYSTKFASSFYGPFREAAESAPKFGNRKSYQMNPANGREALLETLSDVEEGADILMVKPAMPYLDVLRDVRESILQPLASYQVSGEYSMLMAAAANGWLNKDAVILESLTSIKRAGADLIISYFSEYVLETGLVK
ncbi:MAG: porphobilinogen synthase [Desulfovibrionaceae bacterium]|nr:porphobilinogen synthase [Desulfovibrionaceae bacterium]